MTEIPDWAGKRACELLRAECGKHSFWQWPADRDNKALITVAKLVMQHEQPPADPDEEAVKRILAAHIHLDPETLSWNNEGVAAAVAQYKKERSNG